MSDTKPTMDELLERVYLFGMNGGLGYKKFENELSPNEAKLALTAYIDDIVESVIEVSLPKGVDSTCAALLTIEQRTRYQTIKQERGL